MAGKGGEKSGKPVRSDVAGSQDQRCAPRPQKSRCRARKAASGAGRGRRRIREIGRKHRIRNILEGKGEPCEPPRSGELENRPSPGKNGSFSGTGLFCLSLCERLFLPLAGEGDTFSEGIGKKPVLTTKDFHRRKKLS